MTVQMNMWYKRMTVQMNIYWKKMKWNIDILKIDIIYQNIVVYNTAVMKLCSGRVTYQCVGFYTVYT
jgi:hypothetical protein